jgi:hypothetical protein
VALLEGVKAREGLLHGQELPSRPESELALRR